MQLATTKTSVVVRSCLIVRTTYIHEDLLPRDQSTHAIPGQRSTRHLLNFISHVRRPGVPHWQPDSHRQMRPRYPLVHGSVYSQKVFSLARSCRCVEKPILPAQRTFSSVLRDQFAEWVGGSRFNKLLKGGREKSHSRRCSRRALASPSNRAVDCGTTDPENFGQFRYGVFASVKDFQ